jgi:hypothetical protein
MNHPILTNDTTTTTNTKFPKVEKTKPNFLVIKLSYNFNIVLPYKEGLGLLQAMESAEVFKIRNYNKNDARVLPMSYAGDSSDKLEATILSHDEYMQAKLNQLLDPEQPNR